MIEISNEGNWCDGRKLEWYILFLLVPPEKTFNCLGPHLTRDDLEEKNLSELAHKYGK
jgi:hypothetical protein